MNKKQHLHPDSNREEEQLAGSKQNNNAHKLASRDRTREVSRQCTEKTKGVCTHILESRARQRLTDRAKKGQLSHAGEQR